MNLLSDDPTEEEIKNLGKALVGSIADFANPSGSNAIERTERFADWIRDRLQFDTWPYYRTLNAAPSVTTKIQDLKGQVFEGLNFGNQDYLGLTQHPGVREAACKAIEEFGPHSAGSGILVGNTSSSRFLERELAEHLGYEHVILFPTGWAAGYGSIAGLLRSRDHVVLDSLSHACLHQGASASGANIKLFRHNNMDSLRSVLSEIRAEDPRHSIMVVTEGLFSMNSDSPNIPAVQDLCNEFNATLLLDVAHDLGSQGPNGTGQIGLQKFVGGPDLVMGSFSKTFCTNGGFLATNSAAVKTFLSVFGNSFTFSNAMSPVQTETARAALAIVQSNKGEALRASLQDAAVALRDRFAEHGNECIGSPSAIVPVRVRSKAFGEKGSDRIGRLACTRAADNGILTNLVEFPAVPVGFSRFRMQVMASHTPESCRQVADALVECMEETAAELERLGLLTE